MSSVGDKHILSWVACYSVYARSLPYRQCVFIEEVAGSLNFPSCASPVKHLFTNGAEHTALQPKALSMVLLLADAPRSSRPYCPTRLLL